MKLPDQADIDRRFWPKVQREGDTSCWIWQGFIDDGGYGLMFYGAKGRQRAHRVSYRIAYGEIPEGLELDHLCRNRACVNPAHLQAVTSKTNTLRGMSPAAQHARRAQCARGHSLEEAYVKKNGSRRCRECDRIEARERYAAQHGRKNRSKYLAEINHERSES